MPRTDAQNQQIRERTRGNLIRSAMSLFAQNGYSSTTTRAIAKEAGISTGLMYHYFPSKEILLQAVFDHCMTLISNRFVKATALEAPRHQLKIIVQTIFQMLNEDPDFWGLFYMLRSQPAVSQILGDSFIEWTARLREIMVADYTLAGYAEPEIEALILYSLIEGTIQQYLLDPEYYPLAQVTERIIKQFIPEG